MQLQVHSSSAVLFFSAVNVQNSPKQPSDRDGGLCSHCRMISHKQCENSLSFLMMLFRSHLLKETYEPESGLVLETSAVLLQAMLSDMVCFVEVLVGKCEPHVVNSKPPLPCASNLHLQMFSFSIAKANSKLEVISQTAGWMCFPLPRRISSAVLERCPPPSFKRRRKPHCSSELLRVSVSTQFFFLCHIFSNLIVESHKSHVHFNEHPLRFGQEEKKKCCSFKHNSRVRAGF